MTEIEKQNNASQRIYMRRVPSFSPQANPNVDDSIIDSSFLVPNYHLHCMPDQAVVYPPNGQTFWNTLGTVDQYEQTRRMGNRLSQWCRFSVKTALAQLQFVNDVARDIYLCSNGQRTGDEVYRELLKKYNVTYGTHHDSVRSFIRKMIGENHITLSSTPVPEGYTSSGSEEFFIPVHASLEVTAKCNARCKHCYGSFTHVRDDVMPTKDVVNLLDSLKKMGVRSIELTGGECTIHPDFTTILERCLELFELVAILTNGIAISSSVFDLVDKYPYKIMVQICINGRQEFHDEFVAFPGAFELASKSIYEFAKRGVFIRVPMNLVVENSKDIEYVLHHAMECGATTFGVAWVDVTQGRARMLSELNGDCCQRKRAEMQSFELIDTLSKKYEGFIERGLPEAIHKMIEYDRSCGVGRRAIYITSDGFLHLCPMSISMSVPGYGTIDSCLNQQVPWDTPFSRSIYKVPAPSAGECGECPHKLECNGCLARGIRRYQEQPRACRWGEQNRLDIVLQQGKRIS